MASSHPCSIHIYAIRINMYIFPYGVECQLLIYLLIFFFNLFIYLWLCWVFVSVRGLSLVVASGGHSSSRCAGLSLSRPLLLRSTGSRSAGSVVVAHGPSCSAACGIFPYPGSNPCPLHWQADSQPLRHQGSPPLNFKLILNYILNEADRSLICMFICISVNTLLALFIQSLFP